MCSSDLFADGVDGTLTITARPLTVTAASASKTYDGKPLTNDGWSVTSGEFVEGQGFASVTVEGSITDPGTAKNEVTGWEFAEGTLADNYSASTVDGTLTVSKVTIPITITAASDEKVYDGTPLVNDGYTFTQGVIVEGDELTVTVEGSATNVSDSGVNAVASYKVTRGETDVTANYTFAEPVSGELTVTPRPVTFTGDSAEVTYDGTEQYVVGYTTNDGEGTGLVEGHFANVEAYASGMLPGTYEGYITPAEEVRIYSGEPIATASLDGEEAAVTVSGRAVMVSSPSTLSANV